MAKSAHVSLVLWSPSTVTRLNDFATAALSARRRFAGETFASVVRKMSVVARFGQIMPEPLHMPPTVTRPPASGNDAAACLGFVSVVMIAAAAFAPPSGESALAASRTPLRMRSIGRRRPIVPVEQTRISSTGRPSAAAAAFPVATVSA